MQVDNTGTTIVLDAKATQAIEEGKNRITMLQVEELRLKNLKKSLESEIIALEADIDYKEDKVMELGSILDELDKDYQEANERLAKTITKRIVVNDELAEREEAVQAKETAVHERELEVNKRADTVINLTAKLELAQTSFDVKNQAANEKLNKMDAFLKSL